MSEKQIAEKKVKPYLVGLGFPEDLISDYDSVLVRFGTGTGRVDFVCYHMKGDEKVPFLVVEVKTSNEDMGPLQAESYAQRLDAPFFAVTNGEDWHWFLTKKGQANYLRLKECPVPLFYQKSLAGKMGIKSKKDIAELVEIYEDKLAADTKKCPIKFTSCHFIDRPYDECTGCLVWNITWFNWATKKLSEFYEGFKSMSAQKLAAIMGDQSILWSIYPKNSQEIRRWVLRNPDKTKEIIKYLTDQNIPVEKRFDELVSGQHKIPGIGPYLASMMFASLENEQFTIVSNRNLEGLSRLGLIEIQPTVFQGMDYLNFNKILLELGQVFRDDFRFRWKALVHDFTLLVGNYLDVGIWRG